MIQQALASYLVNAAWQAPVVALCALIVARFGGFSPGARNRLWLGFLAIAVVLPAVALDRLLPHALPVVTRVPSSNALPDPAALPDLPDLPDLPAAVAAPALQLAPWSAWTMIALAAAIAALLVARLVVASLAARRLVAESRPVVLPADVAEALGKLARAHNRAVPPVRRSAAVRSPAVVGALRPVILIPDGLNAGDEELRAALLHELAHVLRHDYAVNLACEVLTLPVSWHPATLSLKAGVRHSRELACDAMAAEAMGSPKTYARRLVSLAQSLGASPAPPTTQAALAVGLFGRSDLEDRLMQLMNPRDAEAPAVRAARFCGLAALGAGLLGSAALLHVTPVFAQAATAPAAAPVKVSPLSPISPINPVSPVAAVAPVAPVEPAAPVTVHHRHGLVYSKKGVIFEIGQTGYRHSFTAANGEAITVVNDDPAEPSAQQKGEWEAEAREAQAKAAAAEALVNSPEFKARIERAKATGEAARKMIESPEFKAKIDAARAAGEAARAMTSSPEFKAMMAKARADGEAARAMTNSPEFKAMIAKARADGEAARAMVNSPEFKAKIDADRIAGEAARAYTESPEFKAQMARIREDNAEMRREMEEWRAREKAPGSPTP